MASDSGYIIQIPALTRLLLLPYKRPSCTNSFGSLEWEFSNLWKTIKFIDVHLSINPTGIKSTLCKTPMNLYLHLLPRSAPPPRILPGLIIGMKKRIYVLMLVKQPDQVHDVIYGDSHDGSVGFLE
jgi:hypothetical protein